MLSNLETKDLTYFDKILDENIQTIKIEIKSFESQKFL